MSCNLIIAGSPRSGTSWLGKIFDSHPDTIYRHEPDSVVFRSSFPYMIPRAETAAFVGEARAFLDELAAHHTFKTLGGKPYFRKSYRGAAHEYLRRLIAVGAYGLQAVLGETAGLKRLNIPDLVSRRPKAEFVVIKSVSCLGRLAALSQASPETKILHLVRHPCGYGSSILRGMRLGKLEPRNAVSTQERLETARQYGIKDADHAAMDSLTSFVWTWVIVNEHAFRCLRDAPNYRLLVYERLCERPMDVARDLMEWSGLDWHSQCEEFVKRSLGSNRRSAHYFATVRDPLYAANKWKRELGEEQIEAVQEIAGRSILWANFSPVPAEDANQPT